MFKTNFEGRARALFCVAAIGLLTCASGAAEIPVSGKANPKYQTFDAAILSFMREQNISAGSIAIRQNNQLVYERGFGWSDEQKQKPVEPNAFFRIASLTKPITAAAVDALIAQHKFSLQTKIFDLLKLPAPPAGSTPDPRLKLITIENLMQHRGGWDRKESNDPTWAVAPISKAMGLDRPPNPTEIATYMTGQPLQHDPGSTYAYSNFGYVLLGLAIEKVTGCDVQTFVAKTVLSPLKITDYVRARSLQADCDPREVWYDDPTMVESAVDPQSKEKVSKAYGGFVIEYHGATGAWAMSAASYAKFMESFAPMGERTERGKHYKHGGVQPGVRTCALWRGDGTKIVVFFNKRVEVETFDQQLQTLADALEGAKPIAVRKSPNGRG